MGHHSRSKALAHVSQNAEKHAKDRNHDHHATALVAVGQAKNDSRDDDADCGAARERVKLALEVTAEDDFLKQPCANAQEHKESGLKIGVRRDRAEHLLGVVLYLFEVVKVDGAQSDAQAKENEAGYQHEADRQPEVE